MKSKKLEQTVSSRYNQETFCSKHFTAHLVPSSKYPVKISIASVTGNTSVSDLSADELQDWYWLTHIVLCALDSAFGTTDFDTLSAKAPNTTDEQARTLPAALALKPPIKPTINFNGQLYWFYCRPRDGDGTYPPLPKDVVERAVRELREVYSTIGSLCSDLVDPS